MEMERRRLGLSSPIRSDRPAHALNVEKLGGSALSAWHFRYPPSRVASIDAKTPIRFWTFRQDRGTNDILLDET